MTLEDLARLVNEMRQAQKTYFRTKSASALDEAKRLEKQVDDACREVLNRQQQMF